MRNLLDYLWDKFEESFAGSTAFSADKADASTFKNFAREQLAKNPPVQVAYPESGLSLILADHEQVLLSTSSEVAPAPGSLQPSSFVPVTGGEGVRGVARGG